MGSCVIQNIATKMTIRHNLFDRFIFNVCDCSIFNSKCFVDYFIFGESKDKMKQMTEYMNSFRSIQYFFNFSIRVTYDLKINPFYVITFYFLLDLFLNVTHLHFYL